MRGLVMGGVGYISAVVGGTPFVRGDLLDSETLHRTLREQRTEASCTWLPPRSLASPSLGAHGPQRQVDFHPGGRKAQTQTEPWKPGRPAPQPKEAETKGRSSYQPNRKTHKCNAILHHYP
jgi:hypothetical protein